jgi:hypothetical protein
MMTMSVAAISIKGLFATFSINDTKHDNTLPFMLNAIMLNVIMLIVAFYILLGYLLHFIYGYAECHNAEYRILYIVMLNFIMMSIAFCI